MIGYIILVGGACMAIERLRPGWVLPRVSTWPWRVVAANLVQLAVVLLAGLTWESWLQAQSIFSISQTLPPLAAGALAYFFATFIFYWWHRWRHESDTLWRIFHQIHHSPQRIELITSFYKHPLEMIANSLVGSVLIFSVLGLSLEASAVYTACTALGEFFYHTSTTTPRWIGYVFQRPEMHRIHHQYDRHKNNYGDIVWWDMLFGTYENPREFSATCGFDGVNEERLGEMLRFVDVHQTAHQTPPPSA